MEPFDKFAGSRKSSDSLEWTPDLLLAFKEAKSHLDEINETYLPKPSDQLILKPDAAKLKNCTGWVLYAITNPGPNQSLLPVMFCSARLPDYMGKWYPCELEAVGAVLAIDQCAHWINEALSTTIVMPDSMPVVKAANLMRRGKHSKNPRLQSLLACVNRRNITFVHNSAKRGDHLVPDTLSRLTIHCSCQDCSVSKFLQEIPHDAEMISITAVANSVACISNIIWANTNSAVDAVTKQTTLNSLYGDIGSVPFGNKKVWKNLQQSDKDCMNTVDLLRTGNIPTKKNKSRIINKLLAECSISKCGLLVKKEYDHRTLREVEKIVVPQHYLHSILTILHVKLMHPTVHQLSLVFNKYFFAPNSAKISQEIKDKCSSCISFSKLPSQITTMKPTKVPRHPGSHMNVDVLKRASQNILVCVDMFSGFTTAAFIPSETKEALTQGLIQTITPIRHSPTVVIRSDNAPAFKSLAANLPSELIENGISIELGDDANKNSNSIVDKMIQELEVEVKKLAPEGEKLSEGRLGHAVTLLNTRIRQYGLSSSNLHFSRDPIQGVNLHIDDLKLAEEKTKTRLKKNDVRTNPSTKNIPSPEIFPGDLVVVPHESTKHTARTPRLITDVHQGKASLTKILHSSEHQEKAPTLSHIPRQVDTKFLKLSSRPPPTLIKNQLECHGKPKKQEEKWIPRPQSDSDSDSEEEGQTLIRSDNLTRNDPHQTNPDVGATSIDPPNPLPVSQETIDHPLQ